MTARRRPARTFTTARSGRQLADRVIHGCLPESGPWCWPEPRRGKLRFFPSSLST
jgi:hypothetical protein